MNDVIEVRYLGVLVRVAEVSPEPKHGVAALGKVSIKCLVPLAPLVIWRGVVDEHGRVGDRGYRLVERSPLGRVRWSANKPHSVRAVYDASRNVRLDRREQVSVAKADSKRA